MATMEMGALRGVLRSAYRTIQQRILRGFECWDGHRDPTPEGCAYCGYSHRQAAEAEVESWLPATYEDEPDDIGVYHRVPSDTD